MENQEYQENRDKIRQLFQYIKDLWALKYTVVTDIHQQNWSCFLADIPVDPEYISVFYRDQSEEEEAPAPSGEDTEEENSILLEVRKPELQPCPPPPALLLAWLLPGWERFEREAPAYRDSLADPAAEAEAEPERFDDEQTRTVAYANWLTRWQPWAREQRRRQTSRRFFTQLYQLYIELKREAETQELLVGNGLLREVDNPAVCHPLLLKRVKLEFDPQANIIRIRDTDSDPMLYSLLLQSVETLDFSAVKPLQEELLEHDYHPLDRIAAPAFLETLAHRLRADSQYLADSSQRPGPEDKLTVSFQPVYFSRRRIDGTLKAIEEIIAAIEESGYVPGPLLDLMGNTPIDVPSAPLAPPDVDQQLAALSGENVEILLAKEANREQLEVAERIREHNAVLVQGPPGTGKTHTIANLLGHFLAQGENVLVTSQTAKALSVLKSQVPAAIRDLCVSLLDDSNKDMTRAVDGITEYLAKCSSHELAEKITAADGERQEVISRLADLRRRIFALKQRESASLVYQGQSYSPTQMAAWVRQREADLSYIPGPIPWDTPLPLSREELNDLYRSNAALSSAEEGELARALPDPRLFASPADFAALLQAVPAANQALEQAGSGLGIPLRCDFAGDCLRQVGENVIVLPQPQAAALDALTAQVNAGRELDDWMIEAAADGKRGGAYRQKWQLLIEALEAAVACAEATVLATLGKTISFAPDIPLAQLQTALPELTDIFRRKGRVSKLDFLFRKNLEAAWQAVSVNGQPLASAGDCAAALQALSLREKRRQAALLWDELMVSPSFASLDEEPEQVAKGRIPAIRRALAWYEHEYAALLITLNAAGIEPEALFRFTDLDSEEARTRKILTAVQNRLPHYIRAGRAYLVLRQAERYDKNAAALLLAGQRDDSPCCGALARAIRDKDAVAYEAAYQELGTLYEKYSLQAGRAALLARLAAAAPAWSQAIQARQGCHGGEVCPAEIELAWQWTQFSTFLTELMSEPFAALQKQAVALGRELREKTAALAATKAWYHLLLRTERNTDMRQALNGWKLTVTKIGKGTGKNAPLLRRQAREKMAKCQAAVPAWIMPLNKALENLDPRESRFDVLIIDEASQSDVSALAILYMAKKVIIVGDDKQVSPSAVGVDVDRMNDLRNIHIKDVIPNWDLYDAKTSLYDLAKTTYQPLMLREHFRCVPEIIGYSNQLSYDGRIKPLRDASTCLLRPAVIPYQVAGRRQGRRKLNQTEAEAVVALLCACLEQPEYAGKSFGAISLLGDDQAKLIQQYIFQHIEPAVAEERRILCGNASHFQGDERDVIFLSLVDSNEGDGPLRLSGEGADQATKQRYNVAASRAKDQLFIVHSLAYATDLKSGDMRRNLLEYAENPRAFLEQAAESGKKAESPFEAAVAQALLAAGYHISQQWPVGAYRIDMVAISGQRKIAIECDGEICHSREEEIRRDMERQTILERVGWRFIRIRGSEYYLYPTETMQRVCRELEDYGIQPEGLPEQSAPDTPTLLSRVKQRAAQLIAAWQEAAVAQKALPEADTAPAEEAPPGADAVAQAEEAQPAVDAAQSEKAPAAEALPEPPTEPQTDAPPVKPAKAAKAAKSVKAAKPEAGEKPTKAAKPAKAEKAAKSEQADQGEQPEQAAAPVRKKKRE